MPKILDLDLEKSLEMSIEVINELIVKNETICDNQLISDTIKNSTFSSNKQQSIKNERQFIPISDSRRTKEDILYDDQPNIRKQLSMKVKKRANRH